ncbi:MAG: cytochrome P450, partial [Actinobacteria bacterium]|nr:cytochrome P450 [Actinomycetota bacterium]
MTVHQREPVAAFDHNSPEHSADPVGSYRALREKCPVAWTEAHGGYWVISGYDSVFEAARDDGVFSSARNSYGGEGLTVVIPKTPMHLHIPIEIDPPEFRQYRKLINPITSPTAVKRMQGLISKYTTWFIDEVIESGRCDLAQVIGVPSIVTVDWLGLPVSDWHRYARLHHAILAAVPGSAEYVQATTVDMPFCSQQMQEVITARRCEPREDVISYLIQQEVNDFPISEDEVFSMVELLLAGGVGTTASLVSQALVWLYQHRDVRADLIAQPDKLARAIEEFLRYFSPTQALARTVAHDASFHGCALYQGDRVLLAWASANRDAAQFSNPDTLDIERWPNRHTAFGVGIHRCAGSHLGRAMATELLRQILER